MQTYFLTIIKHKPVQTENKYVLCLFSVYYKAQLTYLMNSSLYLRLMHLKRSFYFIFVVRVDPDKLAQ